MNRTILICLVALAAIVASCSGPTLQQDYQDEYGSHAVSGKTSTTRSSVSVRISKSTTSLSVKFTCTGTTLSQGTLYYTSGSSVSKTLSGTSSTVTSSQTNGLWYLKAKTGSGDYWYFDKNGDYWYFDRSGTWKPSSTTATSKSSTGYKGNGGSWKGNGNGNDWNDWDNGNGYDEDRIVSTLVTGTDGTQLSVTLRDKLLIVDGNVDLISVEAEFDGAADKDYNLNGNRSTLNLKKLADDLDSFVVTDENGNTWEFDGSGLFND